MTTSSEFKMLYEAGYVHYSGNVYVKKLGNRSVHLFIDYFEMMYRITYKENGAVLKTFNVFRGV